MTREQTSRHERALPPSTRAAILVALSGIAACGLFGGSEETSEADGGGAAAQPAGDSGAASTATSPATAEQPGPVETPTAVPATESITVGPDAGAGTATGVGGQITGDAAPAAGGDAVTPAPAEVPPDVVAPSLPPAVNPSPELAQLIAERERVNAEIQRLNSIVDRDINRDPSGQVRLNRYSMASEADVSRLNRLVQQRRELDRRILEMGGPAPTPPPAAPPQAGATPQAGGSPDIETPIAPGSPDELARLQARRERLTAEIQRLSRIVRLDINTDPSSKVRLNRYALSSDDDRTRLNRLVMQRRAIDRRIAELQGR
jgi:hypothetical protein